jgi:protein TonB
MLRGVLSPFGQLLGKKIPSVDGRAMAQIAKDLDVQSLGTGAASRPEGAASRTQPVALEVPVTVNGARTVEGSDKREPFSETTKTVLIFANGAVIRLASTVAAGQLLFLTNESTKKEVVCQVVKSKHYRNVSGYVELEFTEPAAGFWGMRFPAERTAPAAPPKAAAPVNAASSVTPPSAPKSTAAPVISSLPKREVPVSAPPIQKAETPTAELPKPANPSFIQPVPATPAAKTESRPAADPDTEELRKEAARLQEQLSGLLFGQNSSKKTGAPAEKNEEPATKETRAKVIELTPKTDASPATTTFGTASGNTPATSGGAATTPKSTLDLAAEEMKIPAWLEPLARNATISSVDTPVEPPAETESPTPASEEPAEGTAAGFSSEGVTPNFGSQLLLGGESSESGETGGKSGKGLLMGLLAAGVIAAAASGVWYFKLWPPQHAAVHQSTPAFATLPTTDDGTVKRAPMVQESAPLEASANAAPAGASSSPNPKAGNEASRIVEKDGGTVVNARDKERVEANRDAAENLDKSAKSAEPPRKPALGDVKLAAPVVNAQGTASNDVTAPHFGASAAPTNDPLNSALITGGGKEPAAPSPVGGDVKSARLLHSVPPVYPALARAQRVYGDVTIDALIDGTGRVSTMRVVSGPVLLHQAAKDALQQWRYQPAMLDGKPVAMHLMVTVQFRLQ